MRRALQGLAARHGAFFLPGLLLAVCAHAPALGTFFARDDIAYLSMAKGLSHPHFLRPLSGELAFRLEFALFGLQPLGYHVVNLLLHLLNVVGVYALGTRWSGRRGTGAAAAALFAVSSIGFTPLHWAVALGDLLVTTLLLVATLLHTAPAAIGRTRWAAAGVALAAMFAKETAIAWVLVVALVEWRSGRRFTRHLVPAATGTALFLLVTGGQLGRFEGSIAYERSWSPLHLARNLSTYARWCVALDEPIRDRVAAAEPNAWWVALPLAIVLGLVLWRCRGDGLHPIDLGLGWWLAFVLPVLPLAHHTYLYYLYAPWAGGAIAAAAAGRLLLRGLPRRQEITLGLAGLCAVTLIETRSMRLRETLTQDALPIDPTMREATLLGHAIPALRDADLPPGTRVLFVNPVPRERFDLMTGAPTKPEDVERRTAYFPLEAAMHGGETLRLFVPQVVYAGFTTTIPPALEGAECFYYEQRGWLRRWGRGVAALRRQAEVQVAAGRPASADSTLARIRARGDSVSATERY